MKAARLTLSFLLFLSVANVLFAQPIPKDLDEQISYYLQEGDKAYKAGDYVGAIANFEKLLEIVGKQYGKNSPDYATLVNSLAFLYYSMGNYVQAEPLYKEALSIRKTVLGEAHPDYAASLIGLALLYTHMGNYAQAEPLYKEALAINKKVLGEDHPSYATSLNNLAGLYEIMGNFIQAEPMYKQAIAIKKKAWGEDHPDYTIYLNNLAGLYDKMGNYGLAEPMYKQAIANCKKTLGEEHPNYAILLGNLAGLYKDIGNYAQAELLYNQSLAIMKKVLKEEHPHFATSLNNLASLYKSMGNYAQAEQMFQQAISIKKKVLNEEHPSYAASLNNLARLYQDMGNYAQAVPLSHQVLTIIEKAFGKDHPDYASSLNTLGGLYCDMGIYEQAATYYIQALAIREKVLGEEHPQHTTFLNDLALLYERMGIYEQAEMYYKQALAIYKKTLGEEHPSYATSLNNLAVLYESMGNYAQAELLYKQALAIRKKALGEAHPDYANSLNSLALLYESMSNYAQAEPLITQALHIYQTQITHNFTWLSEKQREEYYKTIGYNFQLYHSFTLKAHETIPQTLSDEYNYQLFTKGLQLATAKQMRSRIAESGDTTLLNDYENWLGQRRFLGKLYEKTIAQRDSMGIDIDSLEDAANRAEASLARRSEVFAEATDTTRYTWQDVQQKLQTNEAAIEIARFNWHDKEWTDTVYYALMVVTPQTKEHPTVIWLKNGNDMEGKHFNSYAGALQRGENDFDSYLQYWQPLDSLLQGASKVYLSLDGIYHKLNLETLLTPESKYLGDVKELHLVGSTKDLVRTRQATTSSLSALLVGNPAYSADSTQLASAAMQFKNPAVTDAYLPDNTRSATYQLQALPGTQSEIDSIGAVLTKQGYRVQAYSGKEAVEEAVKSAQSPRVVHLATHGAFLADPAPDKQENTRLMMGIDQQRATQNPLLRSQLYFSGAQETLSGKYPIGATYDNGILTAYEAVNLNLQGTDLVVLSACETGLGEVRNGEGVFGLQRAFQVAGARSVMMSLWKVNDAATSLFMSTFYRNWLQTGNKRQAFKATQQALRANPNYKHPFYWGAFVLVGE
ncbi:hypothetical protein C7N43_37645 [Sphingobacteriales bacterium UPWRP_1]|nr:hypothetical protein C7N43_37645 [Sphingobacteriales bacterium UPWRP_1]